MADHPSSTHILACPKCGLRLVAAPNLEGATTSYSVAEWQRKCHSLELDSPSLCLKFGQLRKPVRAFERLPVH